MRGLFITGTDTNIGKTVVCAALFHRYRKEQGFTYWKPVQTGFPEDDDTRTVGELGACSDEEIWSAGIRLAAPLSPHLAAAREQTKIESGHILANLPLTDLAQPPPPGNDRAWDRAAGRAWIVEGAGGVLVPINPRRMMIDLIRMLAMPALVVARAQLGTINHTLLTLEALRSRLIPIAGVILVGEPNQDNADSIEEYGGVDVVGQLPPLAPLDAASLAAWSTAHLDLKDRLITRISEAEQ